VRSVPEFDPVPLGGACEIADLVGSKQALFTGLFDGTTDEVAFERSGSFLSRIERVIAPAISPAPVRVEEVTVSDDDGAEREIEAIVAAGDESSDVAGSVTRGRSRCPRPLKSSASFPV